MALTKTQNRILDTMAQHQAELEDLIADRQGQYSDRLREILDTPGERNPTVWHDALASLTDDIDWILLAVSMPLADFAEDENDLYSLATMIRAAETQAFTEIFVSEILKISAQRDEILGDVAGLSKADAIYLGKKGVTKASVAAKRRPRNGGNM